MNTCEATASMMCRIRSRLVAGRGDVEEGEFVGALLVVAARDLDRIAGVAQLDEVDALDDAAVGDVEAGNDAFGERHGVVRLPRALGTPLSSSARSCAAREIERAFVDRAAADHAVDAFVLAPRTALRCPRCSCTPPEAMTGIVTLCARA